MLASRQLVLVTTSDCHFCDHAHEVLRELELDARDLDVDSAEADELVARGRAPRGLSG